MILSWKILGHAALVRIAMIMALLSLGLSVGRGEEPTARSPILVSAEEGDWAKVAELISSGADPDEVDADGYTPMWHACVQGNRKAVELLLEKSALADTTKLVRPVGRSEPARSAVANVLGEFPDIDSDQLIKSLSELQDAPADRLIARWLLLGSQITHPSEELDLKTRTAILERLLEKGAKADAVDDRLSLMTRAAALRDPSVLKLLLKRGASPEGGNTELVSPLGAAILQGRIQNVELLLSAGANPNLSVSGISDFPRPLIVALALGHQEITELLLKSIANTGGANWRLKALDQAIQAANLPLMERLIGDGADPEAPQDAGRSMLHSAARNPNPAPLKMLLGLGVTVNREDDLGFTSLHSAAESIGTEGNIALLVERGASLEARTIDGYTPLLVAAEHSTAELVKAVLLVGANPQARIRGSTALHRACSSRFLSTHKLKLLLDAGVPVDACDDNGVTPLIMLAGGPALFKATRPRPASALDLLKSSPTVEVYIEAVKLLLSKGADPNIVAKGGQSSLHFTAMFEQPMITSELIAKGAKVDLCPGGFTPLYIAAAKGSVETAEILLKAGANPDGPVFMGETPRQAASQAQANRDAMLGVFSRY